ncbi:MULTISPECIES: DUF2946 family protein [Comamonas]|uniref:DUF2946 family protein n=1 Tax=Comamonas TaxID=283 RepID=UPI0012D0439B|nr:MULTISPECIES: DUF2946 family protein [Comamonas]MDR3066295.1 DUF2946 family protein [Comamonas sp.]MEB5966645.1 DUF2946 family protein [Comamonas testosteroni]MPS95220.1 DUF2946 family protein [Comamonas sp.]
MDDIVKQAMHKWPNVPACSGWLGLDARGQWWLRDEQAQACGAFASGKPGSRGNLLQHDKLAEFIGRNYLVEVDGRWYFQNGPQRVYVELESAPWIWRLRYAGHGLQLHSHTGQEWAAEQVQQALLDEQGRLFLALPQGLGMVHSLDMLDAANALDRGVLPQLQEADSALLPLQFGFVLSPQTRQVG